MSIMIRAAIAALSIASIGTAYADGDVLAPTTTFGSLPGVFAKAPTHDNSNAPAATTVQVYPTQSKRGTSLNQGESYEGANN
jgi:hypothetical protein